MRVGGTDTAKLVAVAYAVVDGGGGEDHLELLVVVNEAVAREE